MYDERLADLARQEFPRLVRMVQLYIGPEASAEEIASEAVLRLCRHWRRVSRMDHPEAWLYRVAINLARRAGDRARRRRTAGDLWARQQPAAVTDDLPEPGPLQAAVLALPDRQRKAIVCRFYLDLSVNDTAQVMGCAPGTVRALTAQAMTALRRALNPPPAVAN